MKSIFLVLLLSISCIVFSQQTTPSGNIDYLKKSKSQKTVAWILAGTGSATAIISMTSFNWINIFGSIGGDNGSDDNIKRGETTFYIGCIVALSSIPFFIASSKNKKKAAAVSLSFKPETRFYVQQNLVRKAPYPALALRFHFK
jgi:hypothetical protein